jgi:hypothetical protein
MPKTGEPCGPFLEQMTRFTHEVAARFANAA